jgi:GNAT superfamily N-acetyltransferase
MRDTMQPLASCHTIQLKEYLTQATYEQIKKLMDLCCEQENINLKLELDYKLHLATIAKTKEKCVCSTMSEFLYYIGDELVSYLGISCFDGVTGEICGMTHPDFRGQGFFHRLLALISNEIRHGSYNKLLLLSDDNSVSGMKLLQSITSGYEHSEYRMERTAAKSNEADVSEKDALSEVIPITLRSAVKGDELDIARQNAIYFEDEGFDPLTGEFQIKPLEEDPENYKTYIIDLGNTPIGKINVEYSESSAFISGFGIRPEYRRKGYGRAALMETLRIIEEQGIKFSSLDVICTNKNALNLYKSCGFKEVSIMNYYQYTV